MTQTLAPRTFETRRQRSTARRDPAFEAQLEAKKSLERIERALDGKTQDLRLDRVVRS